jgi:hypothetical protein
VTYLTGFDLLYNSGVSSSPHLKKVVTSHEYLIPEDPRMATNYPGRTVPETPLRIILVSGSSVFLSKNFLLFASVEM